ncbi:MAG: DUF4065 domain-containing protein [Alphaproteobacteria bacterium]|nr:DUF4065 domain-containing protein [Alphaproteobacteria bacterium]
MHSFKILTFTYLLMVGVIIVTPSFATSDRKGKGKELDDDSKIFTHIPQGLNPATSDYKPPLRISTGNQFQKSWEEEGGLDESPALREGAQDLFLKGQSEILCSIYQVANFFLMKDEERRREGQVGEPIDPLKLQKLCYYAQGFYLALYNKPLFKESISAYKYGPYEQELYVQYNRFGNQPIRWLQDINFKGYTSEHRFFLSNIYEMKKMISGKQLINDTHDEAPYRIAKEKKGVSKTSFIERQDMVDFFQLPSNLTTFCTFLNQHVLSIHKANSQGLFEDPYNYLWQGGISPVLYDKMGHKCRSLISPRRVPAIDKWPHQTLFQALMAFLFFPQEIEDDTDSHIYLYRKDYIQEGLAHSARYQDPVALYHLSRIFALYSNGKEKDKVKKWGVEFEKKLSHYLERKGARSFNKYPRALIYYYLKDAHQAKFCLDEEIEATTDDVDPRVTHLRATFSDNKQERKSYYEIAYNKGLIKAKLDLAKLENSHMWAFNEFKRVGDEGIPEGYCQAANMILKGYVNDEQEVAEREKEAIEFFLKAGKLGMISAFEKVVEIYRKRGEYDKIEALYKAQEESNDPYIYYELGEIYQGKHDLENAKKYYKKSGIPLGSLKPLELEGNQEEVSRKRLNYFEYLYWTVLLGNVGKLGMKFSKIELTLKYLKKEITSSIENKLESLEVNPHINQPLIKKLANEKYGWAKNIGTRKEYSSCSENKIKDALKLQSENNFENAKLVFNEAVIAIFKEENY